jgi:hypothetical protein
MSKYTTIILALALGLLGSPFAVVAGITETQQQTVTPTGVIINTTHVKGTGSDTPAVGDPFGNGPLSQSALQGPPNTHQPFGPGCTAPECLRAKERQLSSPYWSPSKP